MALTAAELARIRRFIGDVDTNSQDFTDDEIQTEYDDIVTTQGLPVCALYVSLLEQRQGIGTKLIDSTSGTGQEQRNNQKYENIQELLNHWYAKCPEASGNGEDGIGVTIVDIGMDENTELTDYYYDD